MKTCPKRKCGATDRRPMRLQARRTRDHALVTPASSYETLCLLEAFLSISNPIVRSAIIDVVSEQATYG